LNNNGTKSKINTRLIIIPSGSIAGAKRKNIMSEKPNQLKKLNAIAIDLELSPELRIKAIQLISKLGTHEALLNLLDLAGNEQLIREERDLALQQAREIIMSSRQ
jgi:DTW domain-containing protein YfiP